MDVNHINVAELEVVMKGINLILLKWDLQEIEVKTDSTTVAFWIKSEISREGTVKTQGDAVMLIKRRLGN